MCEIFNKVKNSCMVVLTILYNVFLPLVNVVTKFLENKYVSCMIEEIKNFTVFSLKVILRVLLPLADVGTDIRFTWKCFRDGDVIYGWSSGKLYLNLWILGYMVSVGNA